MALIQNSKRKLDGLFGYIESRVDHWLEPGETNEKMREIIMTIDMIELSLEMLKHSPLQTIVKLRGRFKIISNI